MKAYEMEMEFSASVGLKEINDVLQACGLREQMQVKDALKFSIKQRLAWIPDDDYLRKVAELIRDHYETDKFTLTECHFVGYKYFREIETDGEQNQS